jgi:glyoxylase-like metal-dependent hydrolase (beta-lactamase superfamily II)
MGVDIYKILRDAEEIDVGESWFKVLRLVNNVFGIHEPHHWQEVISYLIIGSERAALFDTGMGIKDISKVIKQLTDLEVIIINSHTHFDHVGDNHRFDKIYVFDDDRAIQVLLDGQPNEALRYDLDIDLFRNGYPDGFDPEAYVILPVREEQIHKLRHGDVIDLGDRKLEVLHTPGHSNDSIMLLDRERRSLFTGDTFYPSWLFAFFDDEWGESDPNVYEATMKDIAKLESELDFLYPCHNEALVSPSVLPKVVDAFGMVNRGETEYTTSELYGYKIRIHDFEGFSILTQDNGQ